MVGFGLSRVGVGFIPSGLLRVSLWFLKSLFCGSFWSVFDAFRIGLGNTPGVGPGFTLGLVRGWFRVSWGCIYWLLWVY